MTCVPLLQEYHLLALPLVVCVEWGEEASFSMPGQQASFLYASALEQSGHSMAVGTFAS